jgi:hypothetical protein
MACSSFEGDGKTVRIVTWQKTHAQSIQNFAWLPIAPGEICRNGSNRATRDYRAALCLMNVPRFNSSNAS